MMITIDFSKRGKKGLCDFIYEKIGSIPKKGDSFEYNKMKIRVEEVDHNRVLTAKIIMLPKDSKEDKRTILA